MNRNNKDTQVSKRGRPRKIKEEALPNFRKYLKKKVDMKVKLVPSLRINSIIGEALKECGVPIINDRRLSDTGTLYINHVNLPEKGYCAYYLSHRDGFDKAPGAVYDLHTDSLAGAKKSRPGIKGPEQPVKKEYKGKVTRRTLYQIQSAFTEATVDKARRKLAAEVYQHLIETSEDFRKRVALATDPLYGDYIAVTHDVHVKGVSTYSNGEKYTGTETVRLSTSYALQKYSSFNTVHQEYYERARSIERQRRELGVLFNGGRLRHFLNKSLRGFFEAFPELEQYYNYVEPVPKIRADRQLVPDSLVTSVRESLHNFMSLSEREEKNEER